MKKRYMATTVGLMSILFFLCSCTQNKQGNQNNVSNTESVLKTTEISDENSEYEEDEKVAYKLTDNASLYEDEKPDSVIDMYLTVSKGNASENANHTWSEVNSHSMYDYQDLGVEKYSVNGLLQIKGESDNSSDSFGYDTLIPNSLVTIRGQTSSLDVQKSYKIKIKKNFGDWQGQETINLIKDDQDGVRYRNKLMYDLTKEIPDMISYKTQFVHLYVKDDTDETNSDFEDYGLYTQVEQVNKKFLKRHNLDENGQLYKVNYFEFYRYEDTIKPKNESGYDKAAFENMLEIKGNDDHTKLIKMLNDVNDYSMPISDVVHKWFQEDNLFSWWAFQILTGNIDTQSRNTLLYSPLNKDTWYFISWDDDAAFRQTEKGILNDSSSTWEKGVSNYWGNVLFQRILKDENLRKELDEKITQEKNILTAQDIQKKIKGYRDAIETLVYSNPDALHEPLTRSQYDQVSNSIPNELEQNYQNYEESLSEPMPFFIGTPSVDGKTTKFTWDNSYDFADENLTYSFELADNSDFTNPIVSSPNLNFTEYDYNGMLPVGQYFIRVKVTSETNKSQSAFDFYLKNGNEKQFGTKCFYVLSDGSIKEDTNNE